MSLASAGRRQHPARILIHGQPGVGKSSWAAAAPGASFADFHRSTEDLAVWGREEPHPQRALTWPGALAVLDAAARKAGAQTLVVDAVTDLEALIWADVVAGAAQRRGRDERAPTNIEEVGGGYKKGYTAALESWRLLVQRLDGYQQQLGLNIILVAHTRIMKQRNPGGLEYDRWAPALHEGAWEILRAWVGDVFYAEVEAVPDRGQDEEGRGRRRRRGRTRLAEHVMRTTRTAGWDAKNREGYPDTLPLIGSEFWALRSERQAQAGRPAPSDLVGELAEVLEQLPPTHRTLRDGRPILDVARHDETLARQWLARAEAALDAYLADQEPEEGEHAPTTAHQPAPETPGTPTPVPGAPAHGAEPGGAGAATPAPPAPTAQKPRSRVRRARAAAQVQEAADQAPEPAGAEPGEGLPGSEQ